MTVIVTCFAGIAMASAVVRAGQDIRFISHRGESLEAPENTMAAFRRSREKDVYGFECDIYMTADNEIICLHDRTLDRTTDAKGKPVDFTLAELKKLDAGSWKGPQFAGERIPTLAEALALARDGKEIYIDIKGGVNIPRLVEVIQAEPKATPERIVFLGGDASIPPLRKLLPGYRTYWVVGVREKPDGTLTPSAAEAVASLRAMDAHGIDIQGHGAAAQKLIDKEFVRTIKDAGFSFHVWTINDAARAAELAELGAETITTDCGAELEQLLQGGPGDRRPIIHWTFDGTAKNAGAGGARYDAALSGAPEYVAGARGQGLRLDGVDDVASAACQLGLRGTMALWFRPESFYNFNTILDNDVHADWWEMWTYADGRLRFRMHGGNGAVSCDLNELGGAGRWYHLALVWDVAGRREVRLYVDGVERATGAMTRWKVPGGTVHVGGGNAGNTKGKGVVDEFRVYSVPLTAEEVQALAKHE